MFLLIQLYLVFILNFTSDNTISVEARQNPIF